MRLKFEILNISEKKKLENAFLFWYNKNGQQTGTNISSLVQDMFEAVDTEIFELKIDNEIFGLFFYVIARDIAELGGGLIEHKKSNLKLAHFVFKYSAEYLNQKGIETLQVSVRNKHYKYNSIIRYYKSYGFEIHKVGKNQTELFLIIKNK